MCMKPSLVSRRGIFLDTSSLAFAYPSQTRASVETFPKPDTVWTNFSRNYVFDAIPSEYRVARKAFMSSLLLSRNSGGYVTVMLFLFQGLRDYFFAELFLSQSISPLSSWT